jgi:dolichyl-phosphate-mannose--protein O-mannosyl transferase
MLFGDSLFAIRFLPALAGVGTVALTGSIARELGGRHWAVALSCTGSLCALVFLVNGNLFSMNAFEPLFWMGCVYLLVRIINDGSPRLWLWFGVLAGSVSRTSIRWRSSAAASSLRFCSHRSAGILRRNGFGSAA